MPLCTGAGTQPAGQSVLRELRNAAGLADARRSAEMTSTMSLASLDAEPAAPAGGCRRGAGVRRVR